MTDRYVAKVVKVLDNYSLVANRGSAAGLKLGDQFLVIGIGEVICAPDTHEELEALEILKGKAEIVHVQEKIATLKSCQYSSSPDTKEIRKVISSGKGGFSTFFGTQDTVTESTTPGEKYLREIENVRIGDVLVKA